MLGAYDMKELRKRLGDMLLETGQITEEQLDEALSKQRTSGKRLGEILVEDKIISEDDILSLLEIQLGVRRVYLNEIEIDTNAVTAIPESLARKYNLIPIGFQDNKIFVVMADPLNIFATDDVRIASGYEVEPLIATQKEIKETILKFYSKQDVEKAAEAVSRENEKSTKEDKEDKKKSELDEVKNAPVVKLVDSIIQNAVRARASDIHIEPFEKYQKIRYRVDGELKEVLRTPKETASALTTRIKILASLNIAERRLPQDGRILTSADGNPVDLRVSVLPTVHGEKIVIRILRRDNFLMGKENLGLGYNDMKKLKRIISSPHGIILVTGPTGSGKSTTLYTVLSDLNTDDKNIITVEDPVEYMMEGINQVNVNTKTGLTFAAGLRSILRQDPDIVMVGEIRDSETAEIAVRAAITGHLVLSTIHTNDAPSTVLRLVDMSIEPYLVASSLSGIIAQRLVRKICPNCKVEYKASDYEKKILGFNKDENIKLYKGTGCNNCGNTGYKGRAAAFEILEIDKDIREAIVTEMNSEDLKQLCIQRGMKTLKEYGIEMVLNGVTTVDELAKIAYLKE